MSNIVVEGCATFLCTLATIGCALIFIKETIKWLKK